jgi:hypothetical protein
MPSRHRTQVPSDQTNGETTRSPFLESLDLGPDRLDDADELMPHTAAGLLGLH